MDKIDLRKRLRQLSLPVFVDMSLTMLVGTVDTFMLSRCGDGVGPVGAVGMVNMLVTLVFMVYQFLSTGVSVLCAQYGSFRPGQSPRPRLCSSRRQPHNY